MAFWFENLQVVDWKGPAGAWGFLYLLVFLNLAQKKKKDYSAKL